MSTYQNTIKLSEWLKDEYPDLTNYEALQIACKIDYSEAFKRAFMVKDADSSKPVALEAIAMALGFPISNAQGSKTNNCYKGT